MKHLALTALGLTLAIACVSDLAAQTSEAAAAQPAAQASDDDTIIYGYQLMTPEERQAHRIKMRSLTTAREREEFRLEHHRVMQERAKARGVTLPEAPLPMGQGRGMGRGRQQGGSGPPNPPQPQPGKKGR